MLQKVGVQLELGEILIVFPKSDSDFRPNTTGNTILLTEQCDQLALSVRNLQREKIIYIGIYI